MAPFEVHGPARMHWALVFLMSDSLIIDLRHRLCWHRRLLSDASTALLWSGWLWLWLPLLRASASLAKVGARITPALAELLAFPSEEAIGQSIVALVGASGTLILWKTLPARRVFVRPAVSVAEHALAFGLPEHDLRAGREAGVCV